MAIKVKLKDPSSIFRDASQQITIIGKEAVVVKRTPTIVESIKGGALVLVDANVEDKKDEVETDNVSNNVDTNSQDSSDDISNNADDIDDISDSENTSVIPKEDLELSLTDLKEKYPDVVGRSKTKFLANLEIFLSADSE